MFVDNNRSSGSWNCFECRVVKNSRTSGLVVKRFQSAVLNVWDILFMKGFQIIHPQVFQYPGYVCSVRIHATIVQMYVGDDVNKKYYWIGSNFVIMYFLWMIKIEIQLYRILLYFYVIHFLKKLHICIWIWKDLCKNWIVIIPNWLKQRVICIVLLVDLWWSHIASITPIHQENPFTYILCNIHIYYLYVCICMCVSQKKKKEYPGNKSVSYPDTQKTLQTTDLVENTE